MSIKRLFGVGSKDDFELGDTFTDQNPDALSADDKAKQIADVADAVRESADRHMLGNWVGGNRHIPGFGATEVATTGIAAMGGAIQDSLLKLNFVKNGYSPGAVVSMLAGKYNLAKWNGVQFKSSWFKAEFKNGWEGQVINYACIPMTVQTDENGAAESATEKVNRQYYYVIGPIGSSFDIDKIGPKAPGLAEKMAGILVPVLEAHQNHEKTSANFLNMLVSNTFMPAAAAEEAFVEDLFFSPESNSIVRSFKEAGGRGLAGVITSMDLDWNAAPWQVGDAIGGRAPKFAKITIGFSPIHDITPGLAHDGSMRAPVYPVGTEGEFLHGDRYSLPNDISRSEQAAAAELEAAQSRVLPDEEAEVTSPGIG